MGATEEMTMGNKLCFKTTICWDITLHQTGRDMFVVKYGSQVKPFLNYGEAAKELGECIMHALACEGKLDNREAK
jgi:hypothetical protein